MQSPLRNLREGRGLSIRHVAASVGLDPSNLSRIERGRQQASPEVAEKLCVFFGGALNELQILYPQRYDISATPSIESSLTTAANHGVEGIICG